jgi:diguanylate cyclase (GGDEF)-like protein
MKSVVRRYDALGRYGGEEFLMVLPGCDPAAARAQGERLREAVAAEPFQVGGASLRVTCSVGVSTLNTSAIPQMDDLIREADLALYGAKNQGRDRVSEAVMA